MPKRLTATEKWIDPWFCGLSDSEKIFWLYLLDNCNHAGIWDPNWFLFKIYVSDFKYIKEHFQERIIELPSKKWFIPKFLLFQYGGMDKLNPENAVHKSVISLLDKEGLYKPLERPLYGPIDNDREKNKDKADNGFKAFWKAYPKQEGHDAALVAWNAKKPPLEQCLKALVWQSKLPKWNEEGKRFVPSAVKYIESGRWRDVPVDHDSFECECGHSGILKKGHNGPIKCGKCGVIQPSVIEGAR